MSLFDSPVPEPDPFQTGRVLGELCAAKAEDQGWDRDGATAFILNYLREFGPTIGEVLVTKAKELYQPHNDRAFGPIFSRLSRTGRITKAGFAFRQKGHGAPGAVIWQLPAEVPSAAAG